ncbi:hypothetical protein ACFRAO_42955 [Streptomyces sp. NPDC056656]|uniref:hypothetical protein n=1 Tax=Streptomyces sp. NPDC056656 TaxID=3345895 RepID=UPI0036992820
MSPAARQRAGRASTSASAVTGSEGWSTPSYDVYVTRVPARASAAAVSFEVTARTVVSAVPCTISTGSR